MAPRWLTRLFFPRRAALARIDESVALTTDAAEALASPDGVLAGLLRAPELAGFVRLAGVDVARAVAVPLPQIAVGALQLNTKALMQAAGRSEARVGDLLALLLRILPPATAAALAAHKLERAQLLMWLAHGVLAHARVDDKTAPRGFELELLVHNDDYTPQDLVATLFKSVLRLDEPTAVARMLEVHNDGVAVVASLPRSAAIEAVNALLDQARARGFPLLATVESFSL